MVSNSFIHSTINYESNVIIKLSASLLSKESHIAENFLIEYFEFCTVLSKLLGLSSSFFLETCICLKVVLIVS
jgi:hypothetical protein